jgi:2-polyprenyl-3-methyl-5-hydroxy-6-metoxy-1,4-benzoquinol methylase
MPSSSMSEADPLQASGAHDGLISADGDDVARVYGHRFSAEDEAARTLVWRELTRWLQRFVPADASLLDIGCDRGHFVRWIGAADKWAADLQDVTGFLPDDVNFVRCSGLTLDERLPAGRFDRVFMSNYLEHLPSSEAVVRQLQVAAKLLKPGGQVLVLQPNIRLVGGAYWDFIDHKVPLTEHSLVEAAELAGLRTRRLIVRFLPYTSKGRLPANPLLVRAYLALRPAWLLLGKQTFYVGERAPS